eukprot:365940-Chlamydomonas_euryale.AAC.19
MIRGSHPSSSGPSCHSRAAHRAAQRNAMEKRMVCSTTFMQPCHNGQPQSPTCLGCEGFCEYAVPSGISGPAQHIRMPDRSESSAYIMTLAGARSHPDRMHQAQATMNLRIIGSQWRNLESSSSPCSTRLNCSARSLCSKASRRWSVCAGRKKPAMPTSRRLHINSPHSDSSQTPLAAQQRGGTSGVCIVLQVTCSIDIKAITALQ